MTHSHRRHPLKGTGIRLHPLHYWCVLAILAIVAMTGIAWSIIHDLLHLEGHFASRPLLQVHGAFSFLSLMAIGSMLPQHMRFAWVARRNVATGVLMTLALLVIGMTAYGLYYASEDWHTVAKWSHLAVGILAAFILPVHMIVGRSRRQR